MYLSAELLNCKPERLLVTPTLDIYTEHLYEPILKMPSPEILYLS